MRGPSAVMAMAGTDPSRHFDTVDQMITEIRNARVWGGLHYRGSTLVGSRLGDQVARWDLLRGPFRTTDGGLDPHH